jgi:hypothetical protein
METPVIDVELEEFAKKVMQSKALHYDMGYIDLFLSEHSQDLRKDLRKVLETRKIKTVLNYLNKNGITISYCHFCDIVARGDLKEKIKYQKKKKESAKFTQLETETPITQRQKTPREKPKTLAEIQAETEAFFKASRAKPSAAVQKRLDRLNNNGEKNK